MPLQDHLPPLNREFVAHFGEMLRSIFQAPSTDRGGITPFQAL